MINKDPLVLSSVRRVKSIDISKQSGRTTKTQSYKKKQSDVYYDANIESIKPPISKVVLDFKRLTARK